MTDNTLPRRSLCPAKALRDTSALIRVKTNRVEAPEVGRTKSTFFRTGSTL